MVGNMNIAKGLAMSLTRVALASRKNTQPNENNSLNCRKKKKRKQKKKEKGRKINRH